VENLSREAAFFTTSNAVILGLIFGGIFDGINGIFRGEF
jgi:hypothetical protein